MLRLQKISLTHFKNYRFSPFEFINNVIGISGLNGMGKTNLLDAIYYCCFTKSYFTTSDVQNINFEESGFRLEAQFDNNSREQKIICIHRGNAKKEFLLNDVPYERLSEHIGTIPAVIIAPDDAEIITGGSEGRRKYLDSVICQLDSEYLQQLITYNKVLLQRNSLLKRFAEQGTQNKDLLEIINKQLILPGNIVYEKRSAFTKKLIPLIEAFYHRIADNEEKINFIYHSALHKETFGNILIRSYERDRMLQRTVEGIHKDDIFFSLNEQPFKNIASQGQRKSLLFALKLAQFQLLKEHKDFCPLLLLDDVFEKLDEKRMHRLLHWVCKENNGQVFITDTHSSRLREVFDKLEIDGQMIEL